MARSIRTTRGRSVAGRALDELERLEDRRLLAVTLVKDLNPISSGSSGAAAPVEIANHVALFSANDVVNGEALWRTDGTQAGTVLVKDINTVNTDAKFSSIVNVNGFGLFFASDGVNPAQLWRSDGTANGTVLLKAISFPITSSAQPSMIVSGGVAYFAAADANGRGLWKSDGTPEGTTLIRSFPSTETDFYPDHLVASGNKVFFQVKEKLATTAFRLWVTDGQTATRVTDRLSLSSFQVTDFPVAGYNGLAIFDAIDDANGITSLYRSDGTDAGTVPISDATGGLFEGGYFVNNGLLYYNGGGVNASRPQIWRTDGTTAGTVQVTNVSNGIYSVGKMLAFDGAIYFVDDVNTSGPSLWRLDTGTGAASVVQADDVGALPVVTGGKLYFGTYDNGLGMLAGNGAAVSWLLPPTVGRIVPFGERVLNATVANSGSEQFISDGTALGTFLLRDIDTVTAGADPKTFISAGGVGYFIADDGIHGSEVWRTDGTSAGTFIPKETGGGFNSLKPSQLTAVGNRVFFTADTTTTLTKDQLWVGDGSAGGTMRINAGKGMSAIGGMTAVGDILYFAATTTASGQELWRSDGTFDGTYMVAEIRPGSASASPAALTAAGDVLYFFANDGVVGSELWKVDAGGATSRVADIYPGSFSSFNSSQRMGVLGSAVIFSAQDPTAGVELWRSDGTTTSRLKDINPGSGNSSNIIGFFTWNGYVYFRAENPTYGAELWRTNGTAIGTALVADIYPGPQGSFAFPRAVVGGYLLLNALDGVAATGTFGGELYRTDGTLGNASLVKDINPGAASSAPFNFFTVAEGIGYFTADDGSAGAELWRTDGTPEGTYRAADVYPGATTSDPQGGVLIDAGIIFAATTPRYGRELFLVPIDHAPPTVGDGRFLYDDPRGPAVQVTFSESVRDALTADDLVLLNRTTGQMLPTANLLMSYNPDTNIATFTFPAGFLADGDYRISFADGTVTDAAENPLAAGFSFDFFSYAGDANHDRTVDFGDLVALAQNYNSAGKTFPQGDFNFDGKVDFNDLVLLAQRYNTTLPDPPQPLVAPIRPMGAAIPSAKPKASSSKPIFATKPLPRPAPVSKPKPLARPQRGV
jgi:ELWxxDGT repeat protein